MTNENKEILHQNIFDKIVTIIAVSLQIPEDEVKIDSNLQDELDAESIDLLDIRFGIEQEFDFKFNDEEIKKILENAVGEDIKSAAKLSRLLTVRHFYDYTVYKINADYETA